MALTLSSMLPLDTPMPEEFAKEYRDKGLTVIAINSNDFEIYSEDSPERMKEEISAGNYEFPYLVDENQAVARAFDASCTPDFFLFDAKRKLAYRGSLTAAGQGTGSR